MRLITLALAALLLLIQFPLWTGKGGWLRVADMEAQVAQANQKNVELKARNAKLESEVRDLKDGTGASRSVPAMSWAWSSRTRFSCRSCARARSRH